MFKIFHSKPDREANKEAAVEVFGPVEKPNDF